MHKWSAMTELESLKIGIKSTSVGVLSLAIEKLVQHVDIAVRSTIKLQK